MRNLIVLLAAFWATSAAALCDAPPFTERLSAEELDALDARAAATPYGEGLIWTARRDGTTLTIIGTIHVWDPALPEIAAAVVPEVRAADLLLVEATDEEEAAMEQALATEAGLMFITEGPTLPERLNEETWELVTEAANARQIPSFLAAKMQPWFLSLSLSIPPCALQMMAEGRDGLDRLIMEEAAYAGVPTHALEPWRTLFELLRQGDPDEQIEMLRLSLMAPDIQEEVFTSTIESYLAGRTAYIWEVSVSAGGFVPGLAPERADALIKEAEEMLLLSRNRSWIPVIEEAAAEHDEIVVAFGAAHLPGAEGVLALLERNGWQITPR